MWIYSRNPTRCLKGVDPALIDRIYSSADGIDAGELDFRDILHPNDCFVMKSDRIAYWHVMTPLTVW